MKNVFEGVKKLGKEKGFQKSSIEEVREGRGWVLSEKCFEDGKVLCGFEVEGEGMCFAEIVSPPLPFLSRWVHIIQLTCN